MCIIAIKCKGVDMPNEQTLKNMWTNNPHGAGIMYAKDGKVYIDKGYMDWTSFNERIKSLGDTKDMAVIMHFRIATHGAVIPGNTHPFPVSDNVVFLTKLRLICKLGVAHNGIIPIEPREGISDTMEFIASELAPLAKRNPSFYKDATVLEEIGKRIKSKIAILDGNGVISYYGDFITESDGMIYSNTSYMPRRSAVYTYRDANPYELDDDLDIEDYNKVDGGLPPWDTGRMSVWLKPAYECNTGKIHYMGKRTGSVADTEDLWVDKSGFVFGVDYDSGIAYRLNMTCSKHPGFKYSDATRFEFGGTMPFWPF